MVPQTPLAQACRFAGFTVWMLLHSLSNFNNILRRTPIFSRQLHMAMVMTLPVTLMVAFFVGMILSLQAGIQLATFQQEEQIGLVVLKALIVEMGPMMTSLILAATVGSAMAAELGTMKVSEEIDALDVMAIDPVWYLVTPRVLALVVACPVMTVLTDLVGSLGGAMVAHYQLGVSMHIYYSNAIDFITSLDILSGLIKSVYLGLTLSTIGCAVGLNASGGARGVGIATRMSVILNLVLILIFGYFGTWFFYRTGLFSGLN